MEEKEKVNDMDSIMELLKGVDLNRLRLLVEADKDGKCFISPVVVGQPVWFIRDPKRHPEDIIETVVDKIIYKHGGVYMKLGCNSTYETACSSIGKSVFLSPEGAAAKYAVK